MDSIDRKGIATLLAGTAPGSTPASQTLSQIGLSVLHDGLQDLADSGDHGVSYPT